MSDNRYTVVFDGDIREMGKNLFQVVSPFGEVIAIGVGNEFSRADDLAEQVDAYEMDGNSAASEIIRLTAENARLREASMRTLASLVAAVGLLERGGKKAAPSDKMFELLLSDYKSAIRAARAALEE